MINEERVKQLYKVALCEKREEKLLRRTEKYYRSDYIGKELIKSIFTGTAAYLFMSALWVVSNWTEVLNMANDLEIKKAAIPSLITYCLYMALYLAATYVIYKSRYEEGRRKTDKYENELKALNKMYEREEKLKL